MNQSIIPAADAAKFNSDLQQALDDPRLFLFCNYEPLDIFCFSADGQFQAAVQDLYRFTCDSTGFLKITDTLPGKNQFGGAKSLTELCQKVGNLRSFLDHSQSSKNGIYSEVICQEYKSWVRKNLKKDDPENLKDFQILLDALISMKNEIFSLIEAYITHLSNLSQGQKADLTSAWISNTLYWYTHNTRTLFYEGALVDAYMSRGSMHDDTDKGIPYNEIKKRVELWIHDAILFNFDRDIHKNRLALHNAESVLNHKIPLAFQECSNLPSDVQAELKSILAEKAQNAEASIKQSELNIAKLEKRQQEYVLKTSSHSGNRLRSEAKRYFMDHLEEQLKETMRILDEQHESYTLLPQDLFQADIQRYFLGVPSPDGDF